MQRKHYSLDGKEYWKVNKKRFDSRNFLKIFFIMVKDNPNFFKNFTLNYWFYVESLPFFILIPALVGFILKFNDLTEDQIKFVLISSCINSTMINLIYIFFKNRDIQKIQSFFSNPNDISINYDETKKIFFSLPIRTALGNAVRWISGWLVGLIALYSLSETSLHLVLNFSFALILCLLINIVFSFSFLDEYIRKIAKTGIFEKESTKDLKLKKSFFVSLSLQIFCLFGITIILILIFSFNLNFIALKKSYLNQMLNLNETNLQTLEKFYESKELELVQFTQNSETIKFAEQKDWLSLNKVLVEYYNDGRAYYENTFIIDIDGNFTVVATGLPGQKGLGLKMNEIPFAQENLKKGLEGKIFFSPMHKSPISGIPVILLTMPILSKSKIISIVAFPFTVGNYAEDLIKNVKLGEEGYSLVLTKELIALAHPKKEFVMTDYKRESFGKQLYALQDDSLLNYFYAGIQKFLIKKTSSRYDIVVVSTLGLNDILYPVLYVIRQIIYITLANIVLISFFFVYIIKQKFSTLKESSDNVIQMSEGNLKQNINILSFDEIGSIQESLKKFNFQLVKIVKNDMDISLHLAKSSSDMSESLNLISENTKRQASYSVDVSNSIQGISREIVQVNSEIGVQFSNLTELSTRMEELTKSLDLVQSEIFSSNLKVSLIVIDAAMGKESLDSMGFSMQKINESSKKINSVMEIITSISDQINLLALNASIEAARAGEHGRGFAVVADEIGKLADKTSVSIKDIASLVKLNDKEIVNGNSIIEATTKLIGKIIEGVTSFKNMIEQFDSQIKIQSDINLSVNEKAGNIKAISKNIKTAMEEQKLSMQEISVRMENINSLSKENVSNVSGIKAITEEIIEQSEILKEQVKYFQV